MTAIPCVFAFFTPICEFWTKIHILSIELASFLDKKSNKNSRDLFLGIEKIGHQHPESVTNISNLSPTHLVSNIRHQHRCNPWFIIYLTLLFYRALDSGLDFLSENDASSVPKIGLFKKSPNLDSIIRVGVFVQK